MHQIFVKINKLQKFFLFFNRDHNFFVKCWDLKNVSHSHTSNFFQIWFIALEIYDFSKLHIYFQKVEKFENI